MESYPIGELIQRFPDSASGMRRLQHKMNELVQKVERTRNKLYEDEVNLWANYFGFSIDDLGNRVAVNHQETYSHWEKDRKVTATFYLDNVRHFSITEKWTDINVEFSVNRHYLKK